MGTKRIVWLLFTLGLFMSVAAVWAQQGERPTQIRLEPIGADGSLVPFSIEAGGAICSEAGALTVPGGDSINVSAAGSSDDDPALACAWGNPSRIQGYRTIWYSFVAPVNGQVTISTRNSGYDTILAVHAGTCGALPNSLVTLACNDDAVGFTSQLSLRVVKGQTYYVEVADWHQAVSDPTLNLSIVLDPIDSKWEQLSPMVSPLSRHTAVVSGVSIFVMGGQPDNVFTGAPSTRLFRYNTVLNNWTELASMPGETGYAHASAALYNGKIYLPSGVVNSYFVGNQLNQDAAGTHWVYTLPSPDFPTGYWTTAASASWPDGNPWTWTAAVASPNPQKQGYYLIGGLSSSAPLVNGADARSEVLFYSTVTNDWHVESPMVVGEVVVERYGHTAVWLAGKVCVTGGVNGNAQLVSQGVCYDPGPQTWSFIAPMLEPRYGATSAVGPDGRWYVFGGIGQNGVTATTEVYNPQLNSWTALSAENDLGQFPVPSLPPPASLPRVWSQVRWVNNHFWAIGGEAGSSSSPLPFVEKLFVPPVSLYLPYVTKPNDGSNNAYDSFAQARGLQLNVAQDHNFDHLLDVVDVFFVDVPSLRPVRFLLTQIPNDSNFDIFIYNSNKLLYGKGQNLNGQDENVLLTLPPGRYYMLVTRVFPVGDPNPNVFYRIKVEG